MAYFDNVQMGDEVECLINGVGKVIQILEGEGRQRIIHVEFETRQIDDYTKGGANFTSGSKQILFYKGVRIISPPEPKRKTKKINVIDRWVNKYSNS